MKNVPKSIFSLIIIFCGLKITAQLPSYLPTNGLAAWYPFNGNANDGSGNGNNGVVHGATPAIDRNGNPSSAMNFDGNDWISVALSNSIAIQNNFSSSVWIYMDGGGCNPRVYELHETLNCGGYNLNVLGTSNNSREIDGGFGKCGGNYLSLAGNTQQVQALSWHHIATSFDGVQGIGKLYIDGQLAYSITISNGQIPQLSYYGADLIIGNINSNRCDWWGGKIDDLAFWNRALTEQEIAALYSATSTDTGGGGDTSQNQISPLGIPYQAEVRNESGEVLANANVNVRFTLHELAANGTVSYQETHAITTNELGLFAATIGAGTAVQGTFASINWAQTTKFLQVEVDTGSGWITMGNQQLMSVPYALYAANGPTGPQGPAGADGQPGPQGEPGANGLSAYEVWLEQGNSGSESDFFATLNNSNLNNIRTYSYTGPPQIQGAIGDFALNLTNGNLYFWNSVCWSLLNSTCPTPTNSNAGQDYVALNNETVYLNANTPTIGTGHWNIIQGAGGHFSNVNSSTSQFRGLPNEQYVLKWTISTLCDSSSSIVHIAYNPSKIFTANTIFTIPDGVNHVKFELYGGGGGGEPVSGCGECYYCHWYLGNGGGTGSYGAFEIQGNIVNTNYNLIIGLGGIAGQNGGITQVGSYFAGGGFAGNNGGNGGTSNCPINQIGFHGGSSAAGNSCSGNPNNGIQGINGWGNGGHGGFFQRQGSGDVTINGNGSNGAIVITSLIN